MHRKFRLHGFNLFKTVDIIIKHNTVEIIRNKFDRIIIQRDHMKVLLYQDTTLSLINNECTVQIRLHDKRDANDIYNILLSD